jgi:hypothetical protein
MRIKLKGRMQRLMTSIDVGHHTCNLVMRGANRSSGGSFATFSALGSGPESRVDKGSSTCDTTPCIPSSDHHPWIIIISMNHHHIVDHHHHSWIIIIIHGSSTSSFMNHHHHS